MSADEIVHDVCDRVGKALMEERGDKPFTLTELRDQVTACSVYSKHLTIANAICSTKTVSRRRTSSQPRIVTSLLLVFL